MSDLRRILFHTVAMAALSIAAAPALATWHPVIEGEYFSDYDAPDAPPSFSVFPAGIYDPTVNFVGYVDWQDDVSDTIYFSIGRPGDLGYALREFRATYWTTPSLGSANQGLRLLLRPAASSSQPLLSLDLMANPSGNAGFANDTLRLNSGDLYALTISTIGSTDSGAAANYFLGLSIAESVPEPASWALLLPGAALLAGVARHRIGNRATRAKPAGRRADVPGAIVRCACKRPI